MKYYTIQEMLEMIDEQNRTSCFKLLEENFKIFNTAQGSSYNHQAWTGGYIDHITEVMNTCVYLYPIYNIRPLNFSLSDALLVMFLHDLEKPWRDQLEIIHAVERPQREHYFRIIDKNKRKEFRENKIKEYGIILNDQQQNAMTYVEGENKDYSSAKRVMNELAAFCHIADVTSSRIYWNYGKEKKW